MPYENSAGLNVNNHYGPRTTGGTEGTTRTEGIDNEFVIDLDESGLAFGFPIPAAFTKQGSFYVTETDVTQATGTVTAVTIGGVAVASASVGSPVEITSANTGVIVATGATGGSITIRYRNYPKV
jgi:hypothetical protein